MKSRWSIDEILIRLPIINVKLKASATGGISSRNESNKIGAAAGIKVGLRSFNGSFVGADLNCEGRLVASVQRMNSWEKFEMFRSPNGKISLKACNEMFVSAKLHEHCQLVADRPYPDDWEMFSVKQLADAKIALRAFNNMYVSADYDRGGELVADRSEASGWEAFTLTLADE